MARPRIYAYRREPGQRVRVRITNTDNGPMNVWTNGTYRLLAVDGTDVHQPTEVSVRSVTLTAGGRADLEATGARRRQRGPGAADQVDRGDHWARQAPMSGAAATGRRAGPAELRHTSPARFRSGPSDPPVRLPDRPPTRVS